MLHHRHINEQASNWWVEYAMHSITAERRKSRWLRLRRCALPCYAKKTRNGASWRRKWEEEESKLTVASSHYGGDNNAPRRLREREIEIIEKNREKWRKGIQTVNGKGENGHYGRQQVTLHRFSGDYTSPRRLGRNRRTTVRPSNSDAIISHVFHHLFFDEHRRSRANIKDCRIFRFGNASHCVQCPYGTFTFTKKRELAKITVGTQPWLHCPVC